MECDRWLSVSAVPRGALFSTVWLHLASELELSELNELFDVLGIVRPVVAHRRPHLVASRVVRRAKGSRKIGGVLRTR